MMPAETEPEMYVAIARTVVHDEAEQRGGFKDENRQRFTRLSSFAKDMASLLDIVVSPSLVMNASRTVAK